MKRNNGTISDPAFDTHWSCRCIGKGQHFLWSREAHERGAEGCMLTPMRFHGSISWYLSDRAQGQIRPWGENSSLLCLFSAKELTNVPNSRRSGVYLNGKSVLFSIGYDKANEEYYAKDIVITSVSGNDADGIFGEIVKPIPSIYTTDPYDYRPKARKKLFKILSKDDFPKGEV